MANLPAPEPIEVLAGVAGIRACVFVLADRVFAVEVSHAREVGVLDDYTVVPRAPAHVLGVTNLRGRVLPIVDIRPLLGLPGGGVVSIKMVQTLN